MKFLFLICLTLSLNTHACLNLKASITSGDVAIHIDQKVDFKTIYTFSSKNKMFHVRLPEKGKLLVVFEGFEKQNLRLRKLGSHQLLLKEGQEGRLESIDEVTQNTATIKATITKI
jgi:hypothetical protein